MALFRKNKKPKAAYVKMPIPRWLVTANRRLKERIVAKLKRYESHLNASQKKIALLIFCTAMVSFFSFPLVNAIRSKPNNKPRLFKHEAIIRPLDSRLDDTLDLELLKQLKSAHNLKKTDSITP